MSEALVSKLEKGIVDAERRLDALEAKEVKELKARLVDVEGRLAVYEALIGKFPPWPRCTPEQKLALVTQSTQKFLKEQGAIVKFNDVQESKMAKNDPEDPPVRWGNYTLVVDIDSFTALAKSDVAPTSMTLDFEEKYKVLSIWDQVQKLVTLSRDFNGGVGNEFMWTPYHKLDFPQARTKEDKRADDPREGILDPHTMQLWEPAEEMEWHSDFQEVVK